MKHTTRHGKDSSDEEPSIQPDYKRREPINFGQIVDIPYLVVTIGVVFVRDHKDTTEGLFL